MKRLVAFLALALPAFSAITLVQTPAWTSGGSGSTAIPVTMASNVTAGNLVIVAVGGCPVNACSSAGTTPTISSVTDTRSTTWTTFCDGNGASQFSMSCHAWGILASSGAETITVHTSGSVFSWGISAAEFSGVKSSSPLDQSGHIYQSTSVAISVTTAGATSTSGELLFACAALHNASGITLGSGYSAISGVVGQCEYKIGSTPQSETATFGGSATQYSFVISTFLPTPPASGVVRHRVISQ